jgi:hypothetical protein
MKRIFSYVLVTLLSFVIAGCSSQIEDYSNTGPKFDLFGYFNGRTAAWGMVQDYTNKQTRRFEVDIVGSIEGNTLTLVEDFVFNDGEVSQRIWRITKTDEGEYQGEAGDVIGRAYGKEQGNALQWQYDFELQLDDSTVVVVFDDWLYRQDEKHVFNLTSIKKLGVEVGRITLFFQKL